MSERGLPSALSDGEALRERLAGRRPAVFLDYDGTLNPIVDRPHDAVISESMREAVRALASRCKVCVVSGRDRPVVRVTNHLRDEVTPGKMVYEIQPKLDWDKGKGRAASARGPRSRPRGHRGAVLG